MPSIFISFLTSPASSVAALMPSRNIAPPARIAATPVNMPPSPSMPDFNPPRLSLTPATFPVIAFLRFSNVALTPPNMPFRESDTLFAPASSSCVFAPKLTTVSV